MTDIISLIANSQNGDIKAREELVVNNSGLIWSVAKRFIGRGVEADDLYQLGCIGFLKAIDGFDLKYGTQFSTYAVPKIAGEIRRFLRDDGAVKISRTIKERANLIKLSKSRLCIELNREPTVSELAVCTGLTPEDIAVAETATACTESLYKESGDSGLTLENLISNTESEDALIEKVSLRCAINKLAHREATVIKLRYYHGLTQERVSRVLGVSQVQISRIEKKALSQLHTLLK